MALTAWDHRRHEVSEEFISLKHIRKREYESFKHLWCADKQWAGARAVRVLRDQSDNWARIRVHSGLDQPTEKLLSTLIRQASNWETEQGPKGGAEFHFIAESTVPWAGILSSTLQPTTDSVLHFAKRDFERSANRGVNRYNELESNINVPHNPPAEPLFLWTERPDGHERACWYPRRDDLPHLRVPPHRLHSHTAKPVLQDGIWVFLNARGYPHQGVSHQGVRAQNLIRSTHRLLQQEHRPE